MKTFRLIGMVLSVLVTTTFLTGCSDEYDDSLLTDRVDNLENRLNKLEELCSQMNTNISSLQTLINALQERDYITNVTPITKEDKVIGYTIAFAKSTPITIYHGKNGENGKDGVNGTDGKDGVNGTDGKDGENGKDGSTPIIGVKKHTDGLYYWTVNNEWLFDENGNKIKAEGTDDKDGSDGEDGTDGTNGSNGINGINGKDGKDGATPKLKITNGYWYVSYDNGSTWTELGKATGEDGENGDNIFLSVTQDEKNVYFKLVNGTTITISKNSSSNPKSTDYIQFEDVNVKVLCLKWDTNYDGELSYEEAANVTSLGTTFKVNKSIRLFKELQYFTGLNSIESAFYNCDKLVYISIPLGVKNISNAFNSCYSLRNIDIPNSVTEIGNQAFDGCIALENVTFPNNITIIGEKAFYGCSLLKITTLPNSVVEIGERAFSSCASIENIIIPENVVQINSHAFSECFYLETVTIPQSVTIIGERAFSNCTSIKAVNCKASIPPTIHKECFGYSSSSISENMIIYVPTESLSNYKDKWSAYSSYIKGFNS